MTIESIEDAELKCSSDSYCHLYYQSKFYSQHLNISHTLKRLAAEGQVKRPSRVSVQVIEKSVALNMR